MKVYSVRASIGSGKNRQRFSLLSPGADANEAKANTAWLSLIVHAISGGKSKVRTQRANAIIFGADLQGTSLAQAKRVKKSRKKKVK